MCFERDVKHEVNFIFDSYKKYFGSFPKKITDFQCATSVHGRELLRRGFTNICMFDSEQSFIDFTVEHFGLQKQKELFSHNIQDSSLKKSDVVLYLFDNIAYLEDETDAINCINYCFDLLNKNGILIIQSNSGVDLSYLDYSTIFHNDNLDPVLEGKVEWAINLLPKEKLTRRNYVGKRITITEKTTRKILDQFEYFSMEWTYAKDDMKRLHAQSKFVSSSLPPKFYESFSLNSPWKPSSYETISVFIKV